MPTDRTLPVLPAFRDTTAFITGGSSGIGKATAELLVRSGAKVVIGARGRERLDAAVAEIAARSGGAGGSISGIPLDIRDPASVSEARREALARLGELDLLVNNAGIARPGYFEELGDDVFRDAMETNYFGAVAVTRAFIPHLLERGRGHVSFVSSVVGFMGAFGYTAYAASKFALTGFADCLRQELRPRGIGVSVLFPPDTDTPQLVDENRFKPAETRAIAGNITVLAPDDVAEAYLRGIARGTFHILPGAGTRFTSFMQRHFPWVVRWVVDRAVRTCPPRPRPVSSPAGG